MLQQRRKFTKPEKAEAEYVVDAMRLIVAWHDLEEFCQSRTTCTGCPYSKKNVCDRKSTYQVMVDAAKIFRHFLWL